jgi:4-amino-4-deoxy-L-arabinose transferase-like glycosyltransferase
MTVGETSVASNAASGETSIQPGTITSARAIAWARANWALLAVFVAFAAAAVIVPTFAQVATTDDWAYARSSQILLGEGRLTIFPVVAATAVFQVAWGALFGLLFGPTFGAFRLSTVVITALGGLALYGLCRELGVSRPRGALGVAAYLFNPLVFVLAFTFMTDAHFAALLVIATWLFAKAISVGPDSSPAQSLTPTPRPAHWARGFFAWRRPNSEQPLTAAHPLPAHWERAGVRESVEGSDARFLLAGSAVSALAFLTRQQGALIVPAIIIFLLVARRLRFDRASVLLLLQLVALPLLAFGAYYAWLRYGNAVPQVQTSFFREMVQEGWSGTWWLLRRLTVVELMYFGLFALPVMVAALPAVRRLVAGVSPRGWIIFAVWQAILLVGVTALWVRNALMPYVAQFFGSGGLGAPDVLGSRPILINADLRGAFTVVCLGASLMLALVAARSIQPSAALGATGATQASPLQRERAGLVLCIGLGQVIGVLPPSYHYIGWAAGSLDRYLLPLAPLTIALALWGLQGVRMALPLGWLVAIAIAIFSVAGTRDYLVFMGEVWAMGDRALAQGVPLERLDAGSGWDGYHLYEYGLQNHIRSRTPKGGPWWVYFYAPATDSAYVVAGKPLPGYDVVTRRPYSSWLLRPPASIYLLRRKGEPWPPAADPAPVHPDTAPAERESFSTGWKGAVLPAIPTVTAKDGLATGTDGGHD